MNEQSYIDSFFERNLDPVDILDRAAGAVTLALTMYDAYATAGQPFFISDDDLDTIGRAHQILVDQYYMLKGDTE